MIFITLTLRINTMPIEIVPIDAVFVENTSISVLFNRAASRRRV